jgi:hypothetical protein
LGEAYYSPRRIAHRLQDDFPFFAKRGLTTRNPVVTMELFECKAMARLSKLAKAVVETPRMDRGPKWVHLQQWSRGVSDPEASRDPDSERGDHVRIVASGKFKEWLVRYADSRQLTMTDTIVQALIRDARAEGFETPPKR